MKIGDFVDVNPNRRHAEWRWGEIQQIDNNSGQVYVSYTRSDNTCWMWAHLDNKDEIAAFASKSTAASKESTAANSFWGKLQGIFENTKGIYCFL